MDWSFGIKQVTTDLYGVYCNMCQELGIQPNRYDNFDITEYKNVVETYFTFKRK